MSHVRRTLVWGLKITKKIHRNRAGPTASASEGCGTRTRNVGDFTGVVRRTVSLHYPLACPFKGMFSSNGSLPAETCLHLLLGVMRTCRRTRREEGFCRRPRFLSPRAASFPMQPSPHTSSVSNQHALFPSRGGPRSTRN